VVPEIAVIDDLRLALRSEGETLPNRDYHAPTAGREHLSFQLHIHDFRFERPRRAVGLAPHHRFNRARQLYGKWHVVEPHGLGGHHRGADQRRLEEFYLVAPYLPSFNKLPRKRPVPDVLQHHFQVGALELRVDLLGGAVDAVGGRQVRSGRDNARLHQHYPGAVGRGNPAIAPIHRKLGKHVEEAVDVIQPAP
jgi:hypothetical protein